MTMTLPTPNLQGNYQDSCVVCLRGTDTGLAFTGPAEWSLAGMRVLGIPDDQAEILLAGVTGMERGKVPVDDITVSLRCCAACTKDTPLHVGLVPNVPNFAPRNRR